MQPQARNLVLPLISYEELIKHSWLIIHRVSLVSGGICSTKPVLVPDEAMMALNAITRPLANSGG